MTSKRLRRPTGTAIVGIFEAGLARRWLRLESRSYESNSRLASNARYLSALGEDHLDWSAGFVAEVMTGRPSEWQLGRPMRPAVHTVISSAGPAGQGSLRDSAPLRVLAKPPASP